MPHTVLYMLFTVCALCETGLRVTDNYILSQKSSKNMFVFSNASRALLFSHFSVLKLKAFFHDYPSRCELMLERLRD